MLAALRAHGERDWPREACGLVVIDASGCLAARPARNLLDAHDAFLLDPAALLSARRAGEMPVAIYHSHCDAPATLSARDHAAARIGDAPAWPGVDHLIVEVRAGRAGATRRYGWCPEAAALVTVGDR